MALTAVALLPLAAMFLLATLLVAGVSGDLSHPGVVGEMETVVAEFDRAAASLLPHQRKVHLHFWPELGIELSPKFQQLNGITRAASKKKRNANNEEVLQAEVRTTPGETKGLPQDVLDLIRSNGAVLFEARDFNSISAEFPRSLLEELAAHPRVQSIRPFTKSKTRKADVSEGVNSLRVDLAKKLFPSVTGKGIKIGVISDSVDHLSAVQATGDLPASIKILPGQAGKGNGEGTAMMEIVYDMAPDATLYFSTSGDTGAQMAQNILDLAAAGCKVIVDDIGFIDEPFFEDGEISIAVDKVAAQGVAYFSAAGNAGGDGDLSQGWEGDYVGHAWAANATAKDPATSVNGTYLDYHLFRANKTYLGIGGADVLLLQWANPFNAPVTDLDIFIYNSSWHLVAASVYEDMSFEVADFSDLPDGIFYGVIARAAGPPVFMTLQTFHTAPVYPCSFTGIIYGHPTARGAFGIAAIPANNHTSFWEVNLQGGKLEVEPFTSFGPRRIFFEDGAPVTPGIYNSSGGYLRLKPDFLSSDGVSCATPGFHPFFGTSAAAPHAAALAVLALSAIPGLTLANLKQILLQTALDLYAPDWDPDTGFGLLDAVQILNYTLSNECATNPCNNSGTCVDGFRSFSCKCAAGFSGNLCDTLTPTTAPTAGPTSIATGAPTTSSDNQLSQGAVIGIAVGCSIAGLLLLGVLGFFAYKHFSPAPKATQSQMELNPGLNWCPPK